jgi:hypothetical protein
VHRCLAASWLWRTDSGKRVNQPLLRNGSESQQQVSDALRGMGLWVEDEFRYTKSGYSIDMRVQDMRLDGGTSRVWGGGWAVEFDGPCHFLVCRVSTGATLMKRRHLELLVYTVVSMPFWVSCRPRRRGMVTLLLMMPRLLRSCNCGKLSLWSFDEISQMI